MLYEFHCPACGADEARTMTLAEYAEVTEGALDCTACGKPLQRKWSAFGIEIK